jgi:hypothetical protein
MSQNHDDRAKLARLADALMQDILATPEADILAEVDDEGIERARTILIEVKMNLSRQLLTKAKAKHEAWRSTQSRSAIPPDRSATRDRFEKIRRGDPEFNQKVTLAARNGKAPTDADVDGLIDDWADLQGLDGEGTTE